MSTLRSRLLSALLRPATARAAASEYHGLKSGIPCSAFSTMMALASPHTPCCRIRLPLPSVCLFSHATSSSTCHGWPSPRASSSIIPTPSRRIPSRTTNAQPLPPRTHKRTLFSASSVVTQYVDLPPDYKDADGLPFRRHGDLEPPEVAQVFGTGMSPAAANSLLRILHGRRVAGTLDDPAYRVNTALYPSSEVDTALAYLRQTVPVDELINAGLRAEDELAAMEKEQAEWLERAELEEVDGGAEEKDGQQTTRKPSPTESKWRSRLFREVPADDVYGVGAFDAIRARNRAKNEIRERQRQEVEAARRAAQEKEWAERGSKVRDLVGPDGGQTTGVPGVAREMSPRMKQYALAATSPLEAPPSMSRWQRLWPSYATVLALVVGCGVVASGFENDGVTASSSSTSNRLFPAISPAAATVLTLVGVNIAIFALWRVPPLWRLLNRYMIVVPATPRPLSLLGAMLSHQKAGHLLANAVFLWFIGMRLHDEIGRPAFLQVYFSSGLLAFLASLTNIVLRNNLHLTTLGASGAIYGITTAYFLLHKFEGFKILGLPPDPYTGIQGLGFVGLMLGLNLLTLRAEKQAIDVVTHFAGMAVGAAFGEYLRLQKEETARAAAEGRPPRRMWEVVFSDSIPANPAADQPQRADSDAKS